MMDTIYVVLGERRLGMSVMAAYAQKAFDKRTKSCEDEDGI